MALFGRLLAAGALLLVAGCAPGSPARNGGYPGDPLALAALHRACIAAAAYDTGHVAETKVQLAGICEGMEREILSETHAFSGRSNAARFSVLYEACVDASKRDGAMFAYRGHQDRRQYYTRARAVCDGYKRLANGTAGADGSVLQQP